jgi:hypothetical protein
MIRDLELRLKVSHCFHTAATVHIGMIMEYILSHKQNILRNSKTRVHFFVAQYNDHWLVNFLVKIFIRMYYNKICPFMYIKWICWILILFHIVHMSDGIRKSDIFLVVDQRDKLLLIHVHYLYWLCSYLRLRWIFTFGCCILLRIYLTGSLWFRQSQQSFQYFNTH